MKTSGELSSISFFDFLDSAGKGDFGFGEVGGYSSSFIFYSKIVGGFFSSQSAFNFLR